MNSVTARSGSPEDIHSFAGRISDLFGAGAAVGQWARTVVRENLVDAGRPRDVDIDLADYLAFVHASATSELRFAEMVAHLRKPA